MDIGKAVLLTPSRRPPGLWSQLGLTTPHLLPVANRPLLAHTLDTLSAAGIRDVVVIVDEVTEPFVRDVAADHPDCAIRARLVRAPRSAGAIDQVRLALPALDREPVLLQRGDVLLSAPVRSLGRRFVDERLDALALRMSVGRPHSQDVESEPGVVAADEIGACFVQSGALGRIVGQAQPDGLRSLVAGLAAQRERVAYEATPGCLACARGRQGLLASNAELLQRLVPGTQGADISDSQIQGPVFVAPGAQLRRTTVRGPAVIGARATLTEAYVGPYTSIGRDVVLEGIEIENSVVLDGARLRYVDTRVDSSIVGRDARVSRRFGVPRTLQLLISDRARVSLG